MGIDKNLKLIKKEVPISDDPLDQMFTEPRWFAETKDGFDGTAQGYGYKSPESLHKAYWFFKNKGKIKDSMNEAKKFFKENNDVKAALGLYFDEQECLYRLKDGEETSIRNFLEFNDNASITQKLTDVQRLWKTLEKICLS